MVGKKLLDFLRRKKHPKQKISNGKIANLVPLDDTVEKPPTKTEPTQAPQTEPQTQHAHSMSTAGHEQTMTPSPGDTTQEDSASNQLATRFYPERLWDTAYNSLRKDEHELVEDYEKILSHELAPTPSVSPVSVIQENVIEQTDTETQRSQMRQLVNQGLAKTEQEARLKKGAGHVVDVALAANNTISTALKECPEAALAWTGVTFALQMIANPIKETEANSKGIHYIIEQMNWYLELSSHLLKGCDPNGTSYAGLQSGLKEQLIQLYKALLSYQMKSVCSYYRNRGAVFLRDLVQLHDWNGQLDDIKKLEDTFNRHTGQYTMQKISDNIQEQLSQQRELQEEVQDSECLRVLRLTDPEHDMVRIERTKGGLLPESSAWILDHPFFRNWRDGETAGLLWMRAEPGKGKTMLMINIIKKFKELKSIPQSSPLSFFFCQETDAGLNDATAILRGLIYRLVCEQPFLISHLHEEYDTAGSKLFEGSNAFVAVSKILHNMLHDPRLNQVYLLVDALDECRFGFEQLLGFINDSLSDANCRVRWLVSSRHKTEIDRGLSHRSRTELNLEKGAEDEISNAVKAYIDHGMHSLIAQYENKYRDIDHETHEQLQNIESNVVEELHRKAENTFLWVALVFQQIQPNACWLA